MLPWPSLRGVPSENIPQTRIPPPIAPKEHGRGNSFVEDVFGRDPPEGGPTTKTPRLQVLDLGAIRVARQNMRLALGEALA